MMHERQTPYFCPEHTALLFTEDEIYQINDVGEYLNDAGDWDSLLLRMGDAAAFWPNAAVQVPKSVSHQIFLV